MSAGWITRFRCVVCGKLTAGRMPARIPEDGGGWLCGDTSGRFPRRHKGSDGQPCAGNAFEAEWVDVEVSAKKEPT